jgi:hypothetical protein
MSGPINSPGLTKGGCGVWQQPDPSAACAHHHNHTLSRAPRHNNQAPEALGVQHNSNQSSKNLTNMPDTLQNVYGSQQSCGPSNSPQAGRRACTGVQRKLLTAFSAALNKSAPQNTRLQQRVRDDKTLGAHPQTAPAPVSACKGQPLHSQTTHSCCSCLAGGKGAA